jgi:HSP20 family molecular chaperone IbpA
MSSQSAATTSKGSSSPIPANSAIHQVYDRIRERIARRAYDLYQQDGNQPGHELRHWLRAESEILTDVPEIRESGSWYTINVPLRGFTAKEVRVSVEAQRAIVAAEKLEVAASEPGRASNVLEQVVFARAKWPINVDPTTASAYLMNGVLTLTVKRV